MKKFVSSIVLCLLLGGCAVENNNSHGNSTAANFEQPSVPQESRVPQNSAPESSTSKSVEYQNGQSTSKNPTFEPEQTNDRVTDGTETYSGFTVDSVLHSEENGDIHYCVYIPESYDASEPYALYITLPGYQGLYFQGTAMNIKTEEFAFEAQKYNDKMIVVAPQLNDWHMTSAEQTVALTKHFLGAYNIDKNKVYINGYSGGGETLSQVLELAPELYSAALMCSSQWDGKFQPVVDAKTPVYFVIGESDEYYSSEPFKNAYTEIHDLYEKQGLSEDEIDRLVVLDVKSSEYFSDGGVSNQHGGGGRLFCRDSEIMSWLFER